MSQKLDGRFVDQQNFKNKIINGGFDVWQRGTSLTTSASAYLADRWLTNASGGSITITREEFTAGQTLVSGKPRYYISHDCTVGDNYSGVITRLENPQLFSGGTYTLSFDYSLTGKNLNVRTIAHTLVDGTIIISDFNVLPEQTFGDRHELTFTVQDLSGLTIDDDSYFGIIIEQDGSDVTTTPFNLKLSNVQLEEGSVATEFEQRPLSIEESLCFRYYEEHSAGIFCSGYGTDEGMAHWFFKGRKRITPTVTRVLSSMTGSESTEFINIDNYSQYCLNDTGWSMGSLTADAEL